MNILQLSKQFLFLFIITQLCSIFQEMLWDINNPMYTPSFITTLVCHGEKQDHEAFTTDVGHVKHVQTGELKSWPITDMDHWRHHMTNCTQSSAVYVALPVRRYCYADVAGGLVVDHPDVLHWSDWMDGVAIWYTTGVDFDQCHIELVRSENRINWKL